MVSTRSPARGALAFALALLIAVLARPDPVRAQRIAVTLSPTQIDFPPPAAIDFVAGGVELDFDVVVQVDPKNKNKPWELSIRSLAPDLGGYGKAIGDLRWRLDGQTSWTPLSTAADPILTASGDRIVRLEFRVALDWAKDLPDGYGADLEFAAAHL